MDFEQTRTSFPLPKSLRPTRIYRQGRRAYFGGTLAAPFLHWPQIGDFKATNGQTLTINAFTTDEALLRLFAESEAAGLVYLQRGYFLLHASAVQVGQQALVIAGTPGAGKSTTAAAFVKAGCAPLADDMTLITFDQSGKPFVIPTGPTLKIWQNTAEGLGYNHQHLQPCLEGQHKFYYTFSGNYPTTPLPLERIVLLHRSNRLRNQHSVSAARVPFELLRHFPLPHQLLKGAYLQTHFSQSLQIARHAPVILQYRPHGFDVLQNWVSNQLTAHNQFLTVT